LQAASAPLKVARLVLKRYTRPLADEVYKRSPHLPDLDAFYGLLHDPYDGDGVNV
jgi:hypothetical protein